MSAGKARPGASVSEFRAAASLLWLAGAGLRLTILAVPPVIALIQSDLDLSGTEVGILSGLPMILFGIAALPGSLMIARFGALPTLVVGLSIAGVALLASRLQAERSRLRFALSRASSEAARWQSEAERWRRESQSALEGLAIGIDRQFERWQLTAAEKEKDKIEADKKLKED